MSFGYNAFLGAHLKRHVSYFTDELKTCETSKKIDNNYINSVTLRTPCHNHLLDPNLENPRLVLQAAFSLSWVLGQVSLLVVAQV